MASGGNDFNDFPEIVPTREITTKTEQTFLVVVSMAAGLQYFFNGRYTAASISPTLLRHGRETH